MILVLIFKIFKYIISGVDMILSLKWDYVFHLSPKSVIELQNH